SHDACRGAEGRAGEPARPGGPERCDRAALPQLPHRRKGMTAGVRGDNDNPQSPIRVPRARSSGQNRFTLARGHRAMFTMTDLIRVGCFTPFPSDRLYLLRAIKWSQLNRGWDVHLWYSSRTLNKTGLEQTKILKKNAPEIKLMDCGQKTKVLVGLEDMFV